jgi:prepilin-type N-terminal cleavage/methylation domain-containing protein
MIVSSRLARTSRGARAARGFTLTELAVVMAIVGLLMGAAMYTLSAQSEARDFSETNRRLEDARELLLAFAIVNGRLPCPATCTNPPSCSTGSAGDEAPAGGGTCTVANYSGYLPARAIGFQPVSSNGFAVDAWGNPIRYAVSGTTWTVGAGTGRFTTAHASASWGLGQTPTDLVVCSASPAATASTTCDSDEIVTNLNTIVAIVYSTGKNGATGGGTGVNEARNLDNNALFVHRPRDPDGAAGGEFDDQMTWIPIGLLYNRMLAAGVLP